MAFMSNCKVTFDGADLTQNGFFNVTVNNEPSHIFAGNKTLNTAKSMYSSRNIVTGINTEPLTFTLTLSRIDQSINETVCSEIFKILDVNTYKPLVFGDDVLYYNAMPFVGSVSELKLFLQNKGYITIPFMCDAGHGWIDKSYKFSRNSSNYGVAWKMENPCNVRNYLGNYRVYPTVKITIPKDGKYVCFGLSTFVHGNDGWFKLNGLSPSQTIIFDGANKQMYSSVNDNLFKCSTGDIRFFFLEEGENTIWHQGMTGTGWLPENSYFDIEFHFSAPYML